MTEPLITIPKSEYEKLETIASNTDKLIITQISRYSAMTTVIETQDEAFKLLIDKIKEKDEIIRTLEDKLNKKSLFQKLFSWDKK